MNRKIFSFIFLASFPLMASERVENPIMVALVYRNNNNGEVYNVKAIKTIDKYDAYYQADALKKFYNYLDTIDILKDIKITRKEIVHEKNTQKDVLVGNVNGMKCEVAFGNFSYNNLKEELKKIDVVPKLAVSERIVYISLTKQLSTEHAKTEIICLPLTEAQVQQMLNKNFYASNIVAVFGIAGLVAFFIYYFNLHLKGMALLGRG